MQAQLLDTLRTQFGYEHFLPLQAEITAAIMAGQDSLVLMPTGAGKSLCFQLPALLMPGLCIVVSPLIALMKDQVETLCAKQIPAGFINSSLRAEEARAVYERCRKGSIKFLYLAPERVCNPLFLALLRNLEISLFAIDEAHCISAWGHDFRPEYQKLHLLKEAFPKVPMVALTATADRAIRRDILGQLRIPEARVFQSSFDRPNLSLGVRPGKRRLQQILELLSTRRDESGIIYCLSRKSTEKLAQDLRQHGYQADCYHAGLETGQRTRTQDAFLRDELKIVCATIAFGMGIDKPNVRWVMHYNLPKNLESFYQEIGRAGRDGKPADTILFYSYADVRTHQHIIDSEQTAPERRALLHSKLKRMKQYAEAGSCRTRILLSYFNETPPGDCGRCDSCLNPPQRIDSTRIAQQLLSAVVRTRQQASMPMLINILRGEATPELIAQGYQQLPTFGVGKQLSADDWEHYCLQLLNLGFLELAYDEAFALRLTPAGKALLKGQSRLMLARPDTQDQQQAPATRPAEIRLHPELFEQLRALRHSLASQAQSGPEGICSDTTLWLMAGAMPLNLAALRRIFTLHEGGKEIPGAQAFLDLIRNYHEEWEMAQQVKPLERFDEAWDTMRQPKRPGKGLMFRETGAEYSVAGNGRPSTPPIKAPTCRKSACRKGLTQDLAATLRV